MEGSRGRVKGFELSEMLGSRLAYHGMLCGFGTNLRSWHQFEELRYHCIFSLFGFMAALAIG